MRDKPKVEVSSRIYLKFNETSNTVSNITILNFQCVKKCENNYNEIYNRCFRKGAIDDGEEEEEEFFSEASDDLMNSWHKILLTAFIAFLLSYGMLNLFRFAINYVIWIIFGSFIVLFGVCALVSLFYLEFLSCIVFLIFTAVGVAILFYYRTRIELTAELFKEASKALIEVPSLLIEPILTFLALILAFIVFIYFVIVIAASGDPVNKKNEDGTNHVMFEQDGGIAWAGFLNIVAFIWFTQFIIGCQHYVIAGEVYNI
jgi:solute carrier family 44 protein 1 (choline transporter-like protein)